ncbi:MAG: hypothetical protein QJR06_01820 [Alicyclobacillaceae bacterium]|nr:hypothetical protein [Alicyclobacillaceae bacterium]
MLCFLFLFRSTAYAHVAGAFGDFLAGVTDERTTEKLKIQLAETREEIARLTPEVDRLEANYRPKAADALLKLQFYNTIGLDTYVDFVLQSGDIIDVMANVAFIEKKLESDLRALNQLYLEYMQVKTVRDSLNGHVEVLEMIRRNLVAREQFLAKNRNLSPQEIAGQVANLWDKNVGNVDELLKKDTKMLNRNIMSFVTQKTAESPYRLEESLLNQKSQLSYHIRSDHVYVNYNKGDADLILIGIVSKKDDRTAAIEFEAGFLNGIAISPELLSKIHGLTIDYNKINPDSKGFYVEQTNGAILIQPAEIDVE